jgi:hypothetical protein
MTTLNGELSVDTEEWESFAHRVNYYRLCGVVAFFFISGLLVVNTFKEPPLDLTKQYYGYLTPQERQTLSIHDWSSFRSVTLSYQSSRQGMFTLRAENGELLFLSFAEPGIASSVSFLVPSDLTTVYLEHLGVIEEIDIREDQVTAQLY